MMAQLSKRFINLVGVILVVAVIVAGILLLAVPLFLDAARTGDASRDVAASNAGYAQQVQSLEAESLRIDEIERDLAGLRAEIPAAGDLDDVFEIVATAAQGAGATVVSATASVPEPWTARTATGLAGTGGQDAAAASTETTDAGAPGTEASTTAAAPASAPAGRLQVPFTIVVETSGADAAARFLDALTAGPRLLAVVHSAFDDADAPRLTVNALTFVQQSAAGE